MVVVVELDGSLQVMLLEAFKDDFRLSFCLLCFYFASTMYLVQCVYLWVFVKDDFSLSVVPFGSNSISWNKILLKV